MKKLYALLKDIVCPKKAPVFNFNHLWIGLCSLWMLSACAKISPSALSIPDDAFFASRANVLRATHQLRDWKNLDLPSWKDVLREEFSIDLDADTIPRANFLASGKAYMFGNLFEGEDNYVALALSIRNRKKLEEFITTLNSDLELKTFKKFHYIIKNKSLMGWSQNVLILIDARQSPTEDHLENTFKKIANLKKENALVTTNENFYQALNQYYDVTAWVNISRLGETEILNTFAQNVNLEENYFHLYANFDEGKISTETKYFTNPELYAGYQKLFSRSVNKKVVINTPLAAPAVIVAAGVEPQGLSRLLEDIEWTEKAKNLVNSVTLSLDQFLEMISGDVVLALKDVSHLEEDFKDTTMALKDKASMADLVLGFGIKNQNIYDSLESVLLEAGLLEQKEDYQMFFGEVYVLKKDSIVYLTKNSEVKDDFFRGIKLDNEHIRSLTEDNWFMMYADESIAEKTIKGQSLIKEVTRNLLRNKNLRLESASITLASTDNKKEGGQSIILLKDKYANSLLAMLEVIKEIAQQTKMRLDPNYYEPESEEEQID